MRRHEQRSEDGFALVVVIVVALILSVILVAFSHTVQQRLHAVRSLEQSAAAEAAADAGVAIVAQDLARTRQSQQAGGRFSLLGAEHACRLGDLGDLIIGVQDVAGLVNINLAEEPLLLALLTGAGTDEATARTLLERLIDYRDPDNEALPHGGEDAAYLDAGLAHRPKNEPLASVDELGAVLGFSPDLVRRLTPFVTVLSDRPGLDPLSVSGELREVLTRGLQHTFPGVSFDSAGGLPPELVSPGSANVFRATVTAHLASGASFTRVADIDVRGDPDLPPRFRSWTRRVLDQPLPRSQPAGPLPPC